MLLLIKYNDKTNLNINRLYKSENVNVIIQRKLWKNYFDLVAFGATCGGPFTKIEYENSQSQRAKHQNVPNSFRTYVFILTQNI